jgi:hypothetical protein
MQELLTPIDVENILHIPERTLSQWRYLGTGPAYFKLGKHVRYRLEDVTAWLEAQRHGAPRAGAAS